MKQLYDLCQAPTKTWKPLPTGDHNSSVLEEGYFESMVDFIASVTEGMPASSEKSEDKSEEQP